MTQTFKDDLLREGIKHVSYKITKNPKSIYKVLDFSKDEETGRPIVLTTLFESPDGILSRKRVLKDCLDDERYFIKNPI